MSIKRSTSVLSNQRGMTLMTTLVILVVMTVVATMSSKLSIFDTLLARNNKVKTLVYQETANDLRLLANIENLHDPMMNKKFEPLTGVYVPPKNTSKLETAEVITDMGTGGSEELYDCEGFAGRASTVGMGARKCDLFDFQVKRQKKGLSGAHDRHHIGKGKEVPPTSKYSNL
jgi:hypothetical protein